MFPNHFKIYSWLFNVNEAKKLCANEFLKDYSY